MNNILQLKGQFQNEKHQVVLDLLIYRKGKVLVLSMF